MCRAVISADRFVKHRQSDHGGQGYCQCSHCTTTFEAPSDLRGHQCEGLLYLNDHNKLACYYTYNLKRTSFNLPIFLHFLVDAIRSNGAAGSDFYSMCPRACKHATLDCIDEICTLLNLVCEHRVDISRFLDANPMENDDQCKHLTCILTVVRFRTDTITSKEPAPFVLPSPGPLEFEPMPRTEKKEEAASSLLRFAQGAQSPSWG